MDLDYQDGGDELQNLITEITAMRDPGLFISVALTQSAFRIYKGYIINRIIQHQMKCEKILIMNLDVTTV